MANKNINSKKQTAEGVLNLLVVASIGFMGFIVITGLDDPISKALTAPALIWAGLVLVNRFTR